MKIIVLFIVSNILFLLPGYSQNSGLTFSFGPSLTIYGGKSNSGFSYSSERRSYQLNGQFGYISTRGGANRGNMLGIFGAAGSTKSEMIALMEFDGANVDGEINMDNTFNEYYTIEGGMIIARVLRLSAGFGQQYYTYDIDKKGTIEYFSGTIGIAIGLGVVDWVINANLLAGKDMNHNALRYSTGFIVNF